MCACLRVSMRVCLCVSCVVRVCGRAGGGGDPFCRHLPTARTLFSVIFVPRGRPNPSTGCQPFRIQAQRQFAKCCPGGFSLMKTTKQEVTCGYCHCHCHCHRHCHCHCHCHCFVATWVCKLWRVLMITVDECG